MGGVLNIHQSGKCSLEYNFHKQNIYLHRIDQFRFNVPDRSLKNQTLTIQGQRYTLLDRLGGGAFGSVWSAVSPDGNYTIPPV